MFVDDKTRSFTVLLTSLPMCASVQPSQILFCVNTYIFYAASRCTLTPDSLCVRLVSATQHTVSLCDEQFEMSTSGSVSSRRKQAKPQRLPHEFDLGPSISNGLTFSFIKSYSIVPKKSAYIVILISTVKLQKIKSETTKIKNNQLIIELRALQNCFCCSKHYFL